MPQRAPLTRQVSSTTGGSNTGGVPRQAAVRPTSSATGGVVSAKLKAKKEELEG